MNQFGLELICAWKQHKESPCIAQTSKNIMFFLLPFMFFFYKIGEQVLLRGGAVGEVVEKGAGGWIWCKQCMHM
jgi:hypothetical protein